MTIEEIKTLCVSDKDFGGKMGMKIIELTPGHCKGELKLQDMHMNHYHIVHGGCLFTLADTVGGCAALAKGKNVVTVSSNINFLNPALNTTMLYAEATEIKYGSKIAVYDVLITNDSGTKIADAVISYFITE